MSTTLPHADRAFPQRWKDFWFAPRDPTTLGFIRVVTGLLILYTHLAYSLDLRAFFGKHGWYGAAYADRERHEYPLNIGSFWNWTEADPPPRAPEFPHRRQAVMGFIRALPEKATDRARDLAYLDRLSREDGGRIEGGLAALIRLVEASEADRALSLDGLAKGKQKYIYAQNGRKEYADDEPVGRAGVVKLYPDFFFTLPPAERESTANDLRALLAALPRTETDAVYVVAHLIELLSSSPQSFASFVKYLVTLPDDAAERAKLIDYLDYWNTDPRKLYRHGHTLVSVWFHVTDPTQMALIHAFGLLVIALFTVGFCTRVTSVLTWLVVVGYIHRTNQILFGMDTMMNILLVYLMVGNSGAALSVDRLIARYRAVRASLRRSGTIDAPTRAFLATAPPSAGANLGIRLIQVHFCFIYLAAGLAKLKGQAWWSGFAFWDVMVNPEFTLMRYHWFEDVVRAAASFKPLYYAVCAFGVWFTWGLEITLPFLVWTRLRPLMIWMAVLLHAGIGVLMGLNLFELLMMVMLLVFFPTGVIRDRLRGGPGLPKLAFGFDPADPRQARAAAAVAAADVDGQVTFEAGKGVESVPTPAALFDNLRLLRFVRLVRFVPGVSGLVGRLVSPTPAAPKVGGGGPKLPANVS